MATADSGSTLGAGAPEEPLVGPLQPPARVAGSATDMDYGQLALVVGMDF